MGLSVPIVSGIMLIAFTISASMLLQTMIVQTQTLTQMIDWCAAEEASKTIFLQNKTLEFRNDVIVAYNSSAATWISQLIDHYDVLEVRVTNTEAVMDPTSHPYLNPGEEALIQLSIDGLESGSILVVVFISHYGVTGNTSPKPNLYRGRAWHGKNGHIPVCCDGLSKQRTKGPRHHQRSHH